MMLIFSVVFLSSCAKHLYVNYQTDISNTGKIIIKPSKPTSRTFITVNDNLIVEKKHLKSLTIKNVPSGEYGIHYTSESGMYKEKLDTQIQIKMENGKEITKLAEVPPYGTGYWIYIGLGLTIPLIIWAL